MEKVKKEEKKTEEKKKSSEFKYWSFVQLKKK